MNCKICDQDLAGTPKGERREMWKDANINACRGILAADWLIDHPKSTGAEVARGIGMPYELAVRGIAKMRTHRFILIDWYEQRSESEPGVRYRYIAALKWVEGREAWLEEHAKQREWRIAAREKAAYWERRNAASAEGRSPYD